MPAIAIPAALGVAGLAQGQGGKKAANQAAQNQYQMQQQMFDASQAALQPAEQYYQTLLSGNPAAVAGAVGPTANLIRSQAQAAQQQAAASNPAGGEANLAQQQGLMQQSNNLAQLYAGVQPAAAQALAGIGQGQAQVAAPNVGSGLKYNTHGQELNNSALNQVGTGVTNAKSGSSGKNTITPGGGSGSISGLNTGNTWGTGTLPGISGKTSGGFNLGSLFGGGTS